MLARFRRAALDRGVLGGNRWWLLLAALLWGARALRWALQRETGLAWRGELEPGESLVITSRPGADRR